MQNKHITVLQQESIKELVTVREGVYVDGTLGGGGHFDELIAETKGSTVLGFDMDNKAIEDYKNSHRNEWIQNGLISSAQNETSNIHLINDSFDQIVVYCSKLKVGKVNGILLDLGWSTNQIDGIEGLSFTKEEDSLDMRMSTALGVSAADLLNGLGKQELKKLFLYGDIYGRHANTLVDKIVLRRSNQSIKTVADLTEIIKSYMAELSIRDSIESISARVYLALRIAVNDEFGNLKRILDNSKKVLLSEGRLCVITFHSGEESIMKEFIGNNKNSFIHVQFGKKEFVQPSVQELRDNLSSRSAKLWVLQKK